MSEFVQHIINGLAAGTIYALVALGYTMVYGVLKLINFAHGDVMMVGVYVGYASAKQMATPRGARRWWKTSAASSAPVARRSVRPATQVTDSM